MKIEIQIDELRRAEDRRYDTQGNRGNQRNPEKSFRKIRPKCSAGFRDERANIAGNERAFAKKLWGGHPFTDEPPTAFY